MKLKEFLISKYRENEDFKVWKKKFPKMFAFSEQVEVIPWCDEFAVADKNPEVIDEINFWNMLAENGLISWEEANKRRRMITMEGGYASKTLGIAFNESRQVSFREKVPAFHIVLHELGHVYFDVKDPEWNAMYGGGEKLMWLIIKGYVEGNEESVRKWNNLMLLGYEEPERLLEELDRYAIRVSRKLGLNLEEVGVDWFPEDKKKELKRPIYSLMIFSGTIPSPEYGVQPVLANILEGARYREDIYRELLSEIISPKDTGLKPNRPRPRFPGL